MAKRILGTDKQGVQKVMRLPNYLGDGAGQVALNAITGMVGIVVYFYTDKVGIAAAAAGTVIFVAKIVDAFTDLIMGWVMDRTRSRWGTARPWLLWMTIPTAIAVVGLFLIPPNASDGTKIGVALGANIFASAFVYTAISIPFGSMLYYTTKSTEERSKMGIIRGAIGYAIGMVIVIGYVPITNALGGDQRAWIIFSSIIAVAAAACLFVAFCANPERNRDTTEEKSDKVPFGLGMKHLFMNRYWVIMLCVMTVSNVVYGISASSGIYYVKWVLGDENLMVLVGALSLLPMIIGFSILGPIVTRIGPTRAVQYALLVGIVGSVVRAIFPYELWALVVFGTLVTLATIPLMAIGGVLVTNTIAYGEWKFGTRLVGMANAASGFGAKVGNGLGVALVGWILALGLYNGAAVEQADSAITSIIAVSIWVPGIALVVLYVLLRFYDLDKKYGDIVQELEARQATHGGSAETTGVAAQ